MAPGALRQGPRSGKCHVCMGGTQLEGGNKRDCFPPEVAPWQPGQKGPWGSCSQEEAEVPVVLQWTHTGSSVGGQERMWCPTLSFSARQGLPVREQGSLGTPGFLPQPLSPPHPMSLGNPRCGWELLTWRGLANRALGPHDASSAQEGCGPESAAGDRAHEVQ